GAPLGPLEDALGHHRGSTVGRRPHAPASLSGGARRQALHTVRSRMDESNQRPTEAGASSPIAARSVLVVARHALSSARRWVAARWAAAAACAALLAVMSLQMLAVVWQKSITTDEI